VLSTLLLVGILATAGMIFRFSDESSEASVDRSGGVTEWIASVIFVDYEDLTPAEQDTLMQLMSTPVRKLAHLSEYAFLAVLCGAFCLVTWENMKPLFRWLLPGGFCLLYATSDEIHQIFSNRGATIWDVMIDFTGSLLGLCLLYGLVALIGRGVRRRRGRGKDRKETNG
jgi:VanZ family protein